MSAGRFIHHVEDLRFGMALCLWPEGHKSARTPTRIAFWSGLTWDQFKRWQWYFRYRQALAQVNDPRALVELSQHSYTYHPDEELVYLTRRLSAARGQVTKVLNAIDRVRTAHAADAFFSAAVPIDQFEPRFPRLLAKYNEKCSDLEACEHALQTHLTEL